ncbi:hypothetical protein GMLC_34970 [Geomonas limicola]|uniref:Periplasmic heavy metal sensor n=1 Tax=Geomonas limicola TaxID=2740186 RepID=A0A6V8NBC1_9BACT|nr:Spy/CpxP family protein refolding chaperone [Geomonas limicola]GFO69918.1 hypothetical protein GMLC_34970 [Geomonas limicola]
MKAKLVVVLGSALILGGALLCQAHQGPDFQEHEVGGRPSAGPFPPMVARALDLSDSQKKQIESIVNEERISERVQRGKAEALHEKLHEAERAASFDDAAVRSTATALAALDAERMVSHVKTSFRILSLLTASQRALAEKLRPQPGEMPPPPNCLERGPRQEADPWEGPGPR